MSIYADIPLYALYAYDLYVCYSEINMNNSFLESKFYTLSLQ